MNPKNIVAIEEQIVQLEKQLASLYSMRIAALEAEIKRSRSQIETFTGSGSKLAEAPVAKATAPLPSKRTGRLSRKQPAKARAMTQAVPAAEGPARAESLAQPLQEAPTPASGRRVTARKPRQPKKRTRTPTAVVEKRILDALAEAGPAGLSQIEVSKKSGLGYQTVVKKLKELPQIAKKGSGKEGRFFLKA